MSLSVPPVTNRVTNAMPSGFHTHMSPLPAPAAKEQTEEVMSIKYDMTHQEVVLEEGQVCPVRAGDWVVISVFGMNDALLYNSPQGVLTHDRPTCGAFPS